MLSIHSRQISGARFGRLAEGSEVKRIKQLATQHGIDGNKINPLFIQVMDSSPIPMWNFFRHVIPNINNWITLFKNYAPWIQAVNPETVPYPYAAVLTKYAFVSQANNIEKRAPQIAANPRHKSELGLKLLPVRVSPKEVLTVFIPTERANSDSVENRTQDSFLA